jgi:membrane protease YdiL (CAAX protease family)
MMVLRPLLAYAAIWLLFLAVAPARAVVRTQFRALAASGASLLILKGALVAAALILVNVGALLWNDLYAVAPGWSAGAAAALITLTYVLAVALTEEMMLRGLLLQRIRELTNARVAVAATAVVFAVMHVGRSDFSPSTALQYLADGLLLGWIAVVTGSIWAGVGFHFVKNAGVALFFGIRVSLLAPMLSPRSSEALTSNVADLIAYLVATALALALFFGRRSIRPMRAEPQG